MTGKQQSILLGGLVVALLSTSYLSFINCLCCLGVIAGSMVAVWHYADSNQLTVKPGDGAMIGLSAAILGSLIAIFLNYTLISLGIRHDAALINTLLDTFGEAMPPDQYEELIEQRDAPVRFADYFLSGLLGVAVSAVFGAIGGAIGAALFKKGDATEESM